MSPTIPPGVFTEVEEAFFRAGAALEAGVDSWDDLDEPNQATSWWRRAAEPVVDGDDDEWERAIAIARARTT